MRGRTTEVLRADKECPRRARRLRRIARSGKDPAVVEPTGSEADGRAPEPWEAKPAGGGADGKRSRRAGIGPALEATRGVKRVADGCRYGRWPSRCGTPEG